LIFLVLDNKHTRPLNLRDEFNPLKFVGFTR